MAGGRPPKEKSFANMLRIAVNEAVEKGGGTKLRAVADALVARAVSGDVQAIKEVADRLDGKVAQSLDVTTRAVRAVELADDELADIALGSGEGASEAACDPSQLN